MYDFGKYKTMSSLGLSISNRTTALENAINDQVYPKEAINSFKNLRD